MELLLVSQVLSDSEKWMALSDLRRWNDQGLDSQDPIESLKERYLSRLSS